jgi:hypothetical protein
VHCRDANRHNPVRNLWMTGPFVLHWLVKGLPFDVGQLRRHHHGVPSQKLVRVPRGRCVRRSVRTERTLAITIMTASRCPARLRNLSMAPDSERTRADVGRGMCGRSSPRHRHAIVKIVTDRVRRADALASRSHRLRADGGDFDGEVEKDRCACCAGHVPSGTGRRCRSGQEVVDRYLPAGSEGTDFVIRPARSSIGGKGERR